MKYSILVIVESNCGLRTKIVSALTKEGFKVATMSNHEEVLPRLNKLKPRLIILEEGLPIDSFEVCSRLRQAVDVPILMLCPVPGDKAWTRAVEAGADFYLVKPFSCLELVARVKALLRRYEQTKIKNGKESLVKLYTKDMSRLDKKQPIGHH